MRAVFNTHQAKIRVQLGHRSHTQSQDRSQPSKIITSITARALQASRRQSPTAQSLQNLQLLNAAPQNAFSNTTQSLHSSRRYQCKYIYMILNAYTQRIYDTQRQKKEWGQCMLKNRVCSTHIIQIAAEGQNMVATHQSWIFKRYSMQYSTHFST